MGTIDFQKVNVRYNGPDRSGGPHLRRERRPLRPDARRLVLRREPRRRGPSHPRALCPATCNKVKNTAGVSVSCASAARRGSTSAAPGPGLGRGAEDVDHRGQQPAHQRAAELAVPQELRHRRAGRARRRRRRRRPAMLRGRAASRRRRRTPMRGSWARSVGGGGDEAAAQLRELQHRRHEVRSASGPCPDSRPWPGCRPRRWSIGLRPSRVKVRTIPGMAGETVGTGTAPWNSSSVMVSPCRYRISYCSTGLSPSAGSTNCDGGLGGGDGLRGARTPGQTSPVPASEGRSGAALLHLGHHMHAPRERGAALDGRLLDHQQPPAARAGGVADGGVGRVQLPVSPSQSA